jgi:hypothetical protein
MTADEIRENFRDMWTRTKEPGEMAPVVYFPAEIAAQLAEMNARETQKA